MATPSYTVVASDFPPRPRTLPWISPWIASLAPCPALRGPLRSGPRKP